MMKTEPDMNDEEEKAALIIRNNSYLYSMVDVQMMYFLPVFVIKYVYIKTPTPVIRVHKFWDDQPTTSFALFKIHESIKPIIPGRAANALSANSPTNCDKAFNLFLTHSLAPPPFLSPPLVLPDVVVDTVGPPNKDSIKNPIAIPTSVNIDTIIIPCSLKRVLILSPSLHVSLSKNFVIDSLIWFV